MPTTTPDPTLLHAGAIMEVIQALDATYDSKQGGRSNGDVVEASFARFGIHGYDLREILLNLTGYDVLFTGFMSAGVEMGLALAARVRGETPPEITPEQLETARHDREEEDALAGVSETDKKNLL